MKTKKIIESPRVKSLVLNNILKGINAGLKIFASHEEEEFNSRAVKTDDGDVEVRTNEKICMFSGSEMECVISVIEKYRKKYDNLYWNVDTYPVLKTLNGEVFWLYSPKVRIHIS